MMTLTSIGRKQFGERQKIAQYDLHFLWISRGPSSFLPASPPPFSHDH
jgi:hypothetical protein